MHWRLSRLKHNGASLTSSPVWTRLGHEHESFYTLVVFQAFWILLYYLHHVAKDKATVQAQRRLQLDLGLSLETYQERVWVQCKGRGRRLCRWDWAAAERVHHNRNDLNVGSVDVL
jgi:hypothetical protein